MVESARVGTLNEQVAAFARGEVLGRYIVIERLGDGASGVVYAAYDPELERKVAVKILRGNEDDRDESHRQARFVREAVGTINGTFSVTGVPGFSASATLTGTGTP